MSGSSLELLWKKWWAKEWLVVLTLLLVATWFRLDGITSTPTDWHAFRQADTASVTREYIKHGIDLLHPKYQDLSNIASGKDNPEGLRMVEFPMVNALEALIVRSFPFLDEVTVMRVTSMLFSLGAVVCLYFLGKEWENRWVGTLSALTFALLPFARFYSRAILPEAPLLFFGTLAVLAYSYFLKKNSWQWYVVAVASLAAAALLKPFIFFWGPLFAVLALQQYGWQIWKKWPLLLMPVLAALPFLWWRNWIAQYPEGIPASSWLFNSDGIRLRPAWFRWLFYERLTKLILGWVGVIPFVVGMLPLNKSWLKYATWWGCCLIYFVVIATGNVRHDYYQVMTLPCISLTVGVGLYTIWQELKKRKIPYAYLVPIALLLAACWGSWKYVGGYYGTRQDYETAGKAADELLPKDAKIIAQAMGDTQFLFQTNRTGWPIGFEIDDKIAKGAQYYITTSYDDEARDLEKKYETIKKTSDYLLLNLQKPLASPSATLAPTSPIKKK